MQKVVVKKGIEWMDRFGRDVHLDVDRVTHQYAIGIDTPAGRIPVFLTASDLQALGMEAIRITGRYSVFDFSSPVEKGNGVRRGLPPQANRPNT